MKGAVWAAIGGNGAQVLAFILFVLISRLVGPTAFGVVAICLLLIETMRTLTVESIAINLTANNKLDHGAFNAGLVMSLALSTAAALLLMLAAPLAARAFSIAEIATTLPVMAPILIVHAFARIYEAEFTVSMRFRALAIRSLGAAALGGAIGLGAAYAGQGVNALILQQWFAAGGALTLMAIQSKWRPGLGFSVEQFKQLARQSAILAPAGFVTNLRLTIDGIAVASFSGVTASGIYNFAKRTRLAFQLGLSSAIGRVSLPAFGALSHDKARLASAVEQATQLSAIVAFPIFIGIGAIAPELIGVFLGAEWSAASTPLAILMIGGALAVTTRLFEHLLLVCNRRGVVVASNVAALILLALLLLAFGRYGPIAVAAATAVVGVLQNLAARLLASKHVDLRHSFYLKSLWGPMLISLVMLAMISWLRSFMTEVPAVGRMLLFIVLGAGFYALANWLVNRKAVRAVVSAAQLILPRIAMRPS